MLRPWVVGVCLVATSSPQPLAAAAGAEIAVARRQATAHRLVETDIDLDGRLLEDAWERAIPITEFVQKEPIEGAAPTDDMEVRFLYDDEALYVGARMHTRNAPDAQPAPLDRRDSTNQAEYILVSLDTFLDRRTAYDFGVTAAGVRVDRFHPEDSEFNTDNGFNPVWEARVATAEWGWSAELWIPFSQLRFNDVQHQMWGLNIRRVRPSLNEQDYWVLIPRTERAWASRFGDLTGVSGIEPPRRLELVPYVAQASTVNGNRDAGNPFDDGRNLASRVGTDMKMGLGPNLTLSATVNPDFGQVEADPAEVNLSAFETRFDERRPFFTEGSELFDPGNRSFFYSRRIGQRPSGPASADYVDYPSASTILGAAKITGRLSSGTSIGVLGAVTDEEFAHTADVVLGLLSQDRVRVAPRSYWGVARVQQEFGSSGSTAGIFFTGVHRALGPEGDDPLAGLVARRAASLGGNLRWRFGEGQYEWRSTLGATMVSGDAAAIAIRQQSSTHYFQRPDLTYSTLDATRRSIAGYSLRSTVERISGRHWLWRASAAVDSPGFDPNDLGNFRNADNIEPSFELRYRETTPGRFVRNYSIRLDQSAGWSFGGERQQASIRPSVDITWANYWNTSFGLSRNADGLSPTLTRGGPLMRRPGSWGYNLRVNNNNSSNTRLFAGFFADRNDDGGSSQRVNTNVSFRLGPRWRVSVRPSYDHEIDRQQYVTTIAEGGRAETYGRRYVFAAINRHTVSTEFRIGLTLRPDLDLDVYAEPFASSGRYADYGELVAPRTSARVTYGADGTSLVVNADGSRHVVADGQAFTIDNRDFNVRSVRSNVVLRWEWRPGSTLHAVWQQDRFSSEDVGRAATLGDAFRAFGAPGSHVFIVKTSFWLPAR